MIRKNLLKGIVTTAVLFGATLIMNISNVSAAKLNEEKYNYPESEALLQEMENNIKITNFPELLNGEDEVLDKDKPIKDLINEMPDSSTALPVGRVVQKPTRKGIILVTTDPWKGVVESGHAAIVYSEDSVIESLSNGVVKGKNNWGNTKNEYYAVFPLKASINDGEKAAEYCKKKTGLSYNINFYNIDTRKKFYCSQLVYASYKDLFKIDLNTDAFKSKLGNPIHPYELLDSNNILPLVHYSK